MSSLFRLIRNIAGAARRNKEQESPLTSSEDQEQTARISETSEERGIFEASTLSPLNLAFPLFLEIQSDNAHYSGSIHQGNREQALPLPSLQLEPQAQVIPERAWTLKQIVEAIIRFDPNELKQFDERVQLELGQYLYAQTLGRLPQVWQKRLHEMPELDLRILTDDEWIARLPWNLLASKGVFRCAAGWSVAIAGKTWNADILSAPHAGKMPAIQLPPSPRLLIVAPQPTGLTDTRAETHLEELEALLSSHDQRLSFGNHLKVALTWEAFNQLLEEFQPHLIYYYGHGLGDSRTTRLLFATGPQRQQIEVPVSDLVRCLQKLKAPPLLAYINCCLGDSAGFLGVGKQLGSFIPAVISNRTTTRIPVAQAQALSVWKQILIQAISPHKAVARLYANMASQQLSTADIRWITPVLHAHYRQWNATPPTPPDRLTQDPHWHLKIDRVRQYNDVIAQTRLMLREQKPKSQVFVWYGQEGQGIEIFHKRLLVELREELSNAFVYQVRPRWPEHLENYHDAFSDVLTEVFEVNALDDIPARIRSESHGKLTLVYVRHEPVRSTQLINPDSLKEYLRWWDKEFASKLEKKQFALLTVSFLVSNPPAFAEYVEDEHIEELELKRTVFWLLDEMERVAKRDLLRFLQTHNIDLPQDRKDDVLQKILNRTKGRYEQTIEELKKLRQEAWRVEDNKRFNY